MLVKNEPVILSNKGREENGVGRLHGGVFMVYSCERPMGADGPVGRRTTWRLHTVCLPK